MKGKIIETAGRTWQILGEKQEVKLSELAKIVKEKGEVVFQALGWLAREDKIHYTSRNKQNFVSLVGPEKEYYQNVFRPNLKTASVNTKKIKKTAKARR
jgi:hypothetical protein